jgi:lipid-binding SYLF domain-containing protein
MHRIRTRAIAAVIAAIAVTAPSAVADMRADLVRDGQQALKQLYAQNPTARMLGEKAKAILIFPTIVKAGFMFGGALGNGVLVKNRQTAGFYNSVAASYGFQAGLQTFGYALFFMNEKALKYLDQSGGFEVGVGPSVVIVDEGMGKSITSTTLTQDVYAFIFDQAGLMAGIGIQGSKITRL